MLRSSGRAIGRIGFSKTFTILWSIFLVGFGASFFYFNGRAKKLTTANTSSTSGTLTSVKDTLIMPLPGVEEVAISSKKKPVTKSTHATVKKEVVRVSSKGKYKILSTAYFHNDPDESTRRNAFVNRWNNSYATLNALDEKNGFIYVVFRNHLNQTSKGWLRKKDLTPATE